MVFEVRTGQGISVEVGSPFGGGVCSGLEAELEVKVEVKVEVEGFSRVLNHPRPSRLLFSQLDTQVVIAEHQHARGPR